MGMRGWVGRSRGKGPPARRMGGGGGAPMGWEGVGGHRCVNFP